MAYSNTIYNSIIVSQRSLSPNELYKSSSLSGFNTVRVGVQVVAGVDRITNPLPTPPNNPSYTLDIQIFPIGYGGNQDTRAPISKTVSLQGESCISTVFFDVVGIANYRVGIYNTSSFNVNVSAGITEAKM